MDPALPDAALPDPATIKIGSEPKDFKVSGRSLSVACADDTRVTFPCSGTLAYGFKKWDDNNGDRIPLVVYVDDPADAEANAESVAMLDQLAPRMLDHMADNSTTFFPKTKPSGDLLRNNGFDLLPLVNNRRALKMRVSLGSLTMLIPDPRFPDDRSKTKRVSSDMAARVLLRGAHLSFQASMTYMWLDDTMDFGVTVSTDKIVVEPPPPRPPRHLGELADDMRDLVIGDKVKPFAHGGKYVGCSMHGEYLSFMASRVIGEGTDALTVKFPPSPPKDSPDSNVWSMGIEFSRGSPLWDVFQLMDERFLIAAAGSTDWFPSKTMSIDMAQCMYKPAWAVKEPYAPMLYLKAGKVDTPARPATRIWIVPDDAATHDMGALLMDVDLMTQLFRRGTLDDIEKGSAVAFAGSVSCVYIQSATFGWSLHASDIFVHSGQAQPFMIDGKEVEVNGTATEEDLMAVFGHRDKRTKFDPDGDDFEMHAAAPPEAAEATEQADLAATTAPGAPATDETAVF